MKPDEENKLQALPTLPVPLTETRLHVLEDYDVAFESGPVIVLRMGFGLAKQAQLDFRHPNMLARQWVVHEFKHYRDSGGKFWTSRAGLDVYFAVHKTAIQLVKYNGLSYPVVKIGDELFTLNVSGGGGGIWTDWIRNTASTCVDLPMKKLKVVAAQSLPVAEAVDLGVKLEFEPLSDAHLTKLNDDLARQCLGDLKPGMQLCLASGYTANGGETTLTILYREGQKFVAEAGWRRERIRVPLRCVGWAATAAANKLVTISSDAFNRVGLRDLMAPLPALVAAPPEMPVSASLPAYQLALPA